MFAPLKPLLLLSAVLGMSLSASEVVAQATDIQKFSDFPVIQPESCQRAPLVTSVIKNLGAQFETLVVDMTATTVSTEEEKAFGKLAHAEISSVFPMLQDADRVQYISAVLGQLDPYMTRDTGYSLHVLDTPDLNAFALAGGLIYITTGLLDQLDSEAQLLFVLAHELAHHELRHGIGHLQYLKALGVWDGGVEGISTISSTLINTVALPLQSNQEQAADSFALNVMYELGYAPHPGGADDAAVCVLLRE